MPAACGSMASLLAAASCLMVGCAAGPHWRAPQAPADAGYSPQPTPDASASAAVHGGDVQHLLPGRDVPFEWWTSFHCEELNRLVEQAFANNPTIAAAHAALAQAHELVAAQQGFFFPTVDAVYQAERHKVSGNTNSSSTIGVQGNGVNLLPALPETPASLLTFPHNQPSYYTFYTAELTVGFVPDVFGGNRRQVESLAAQAQVQRFALAATYISLASSVTAAAIQEASVNAQIRATQRIIAAQEKALHILQDQFRLGFAMRIDVAQQEAALALVASTLPPLEKQRDQTRDLLRSLVGALPNRDVPSIELDALELPTELPLSLPAKIIEQRPDVRAAEAQLHSANANVGVAVAAMLPQFDITGEYGGNATKANQMFSAGGPFWSLYGNVSQPIFQGFTLFHQKRAADAALKNAMAQYRSAVLTAYQNVADTLHVSMDDAATLAADVAAEQAAKVTYELSREQLETGLIPTLVLLSAQTAYDQAQLTRLQAEATRFGDTVALFQALGGGWWQKKELAAND